MKYMCTWGFLIVDGCGTLAREFSNSLSRCTNCQKGVGSKMDYLFRQKVPSVPGIYQSPPDPTSIPDLHAKYKVTNFISLLPVTTGALRQDKELAFGEQNFRPSAKLKLAFAGQ